LRSPTPRHVPGNELVSLAGDEVHKSIKFLFSLAPERGERSRGAVPALRFADRDPGSPPGPGHRGEFPLTPDPLSHVGQRGAEYSEDVDFFMTQGEGLR
jgi:hypothetical protein